MTFPTVTETRLPLEPCSADTFIADLEPRRGGAFTLPVRRGERALDVFHHPYAHAA